jgi:hypothetical protein
MSRALLFGILFAACQPTPSDRAAPAPAPKKTAVRGFVAIVEPKESTTLRAPQNTFRIAGWNSSSHWTKLAEIAEEGKTVEKGEVIARFSFRHEKARFWIKDQIRQADADAEKAAIEAERRLAELRADQNSRQLRAASAQIDTFKGSAISRRQLELHRIDHRLALFDLDASGKRIEAYQRQADAERDYHQKKIVRHRFDMTRYQSYRKRYALHAPHDGIVRYAFHRRRRRKIQKGDGMPAGLPVVHIARDEELVVRIFVPEAQIHRIKMGQRVFAVSLGAEQRLPAKVSKIERFPQEMGFLQHDNSLPNARDKAFAVTAVLNDGADGLSAGNEVRVQLDHQ